MAAILSRGRWVKQGWYHSLRSDIFIFGILYSNLLLWPWWRHQMDTFSALLALCAGNSPVTNFEMELTELERLYLIHRNCIIMLKSFKHKLVFCYVKMQQNNNKFITWYWILKKAEQNAWNLAIRWYHMYTSEYQIHVNIWFISHKIRTLLVLFFIFISSISSLMLALWDVFIHILQGYLTGTGTII